MQQQWLQTNYYELNLPDKLWEKIIVAFYNSYYNLCYIIKIDPYPTLTHTY